jgi:hypothetical protein
MPASILDTSLVDTLVPIINELRADLHADFGDRPFTCHLVTRTWSGGRIGSGTVTVNSTVLIPGPPRVAKYDLHGRLVPCGLDEDGEIVLTEVPLTFTESELYLPGNVDGREYLYKLSDAHGQGIATRYFVCAAPPTPDRERDIGWIVRLNKVEVISP